MYEKLFLNKCSMCDKLDKTDYFSSLSKQFVHRLGAVTRTSYAKSLSMVTIP